MAVAKPSLRCAIYTRKSSDEGLDQAFNSLHAQREACEAYVKSQIGEGWIVLATAYDDGGISGGTMERPGLKQLLADIDRGLVDVVVVYKVDRLTRSLMDFARIVERFDARSVSFVSVTQAFNTTNSMGRLTLNVLLSFAQFEREVTGERIRDKIAASKAKGMWMGGVPPLGYSVPTDLLTRALVIEPEGAEVVRRLFDRYLELGSVHALKLELDAAGETTRVHVSKTGNARGGQAYGRGVLFYLLRNRIYLGEIVHGDLTYPGAHPPIIDAEVFDRVQAMMDANGVERRDRPLKPDGSPLAGLIRDADGVSMTPTIAYGKLGRKYRYYVSQPLQVGRADALDRGVVRRVSAGAIEAMVRNALQTAGLASTDTGWAELRSRLKTVQLKTDQVLISLSPGEMDPAMIAEAQGRLPAGLSLRQITGRSACLELVVHQRPSFRGGRSWSASTSGGPLPRATEPDRALLKGLKRAHRILADHSISPLKTTGDFGDARGIADSYERRIANLAFLAPDIQAAIVEGRQPIGLTLEQIRSVEMPLSWTDQRALFGFPPK